MSSQQKSQKTKKSQEKEKASLKTAQNDKNNNQAELEAAVEAAKAKLKEAHDQAAQLDQGDEEAPDAGSDNEFAEMDLVEIGSIKEHKVPQNKANKKGQYRPLAKSNRIVSGATQYQRLRAKKKLEEKLSEMTPEERESYFEEKAVEKAEKAKKKLEIQENFAKRAKEHREKLKKMTPEEKTSYNAQKTIKMKKTIKHRQAGLVFPVNRISTKLRAEFPSHRLTKESAVFTAAVLEYMTAELLELAGNVCEESKRKRIIPRDIMLAARNDEEINKVIGDKTLFKKAGTYPAGVQKVLMKSNMSTRNDTWNVNYNRVEVDFKINLNAK